MRCFWLIWLLKSEFFYFFSKIFYKCFLKIKIFQIRNKNSMLIGLLEFYAFKKKII